LLEDQVCARLVDDHVGHRDGEFAVGPQFRLVLALKGCPGNLEHEFVVFRGGLVGDSDRLAVDLARLFAEFLF